MSPSPRAIFVLVLGLAMIGLGAYIALRPLLDSGRALTGTRWLDMAFAFVFLLRGVMNVQSARRSARGAELPPGV